jgi:hypothetical protein
MAPEPAQQVTELLQAAQAGEAGAAEQPLAFVYEELHGSVTKKRFFEASLSLQAARQVIRVVRR